MDDLNKFVTSIKKKYRNRCVNREKQWPPCHGNKLIRLELVEGKSETYSDHQERLKEDKVVTRTPLAYCDLLTLKADSGKLITKVLVEGDAGIGKTTLSISISEDWANGKLFQQFELVLLLPLRMKAVASAGSLPELLKVLHRSPRLCDSVARYLEEEEGESVLIIADGWDELDESKRKERSFLYDLFVSGLPFASVVITSRPSASASLRRLCDIDRFVEVRGFSKEHIVEFIQSEFTSDQEKANRLLEQLEYNPLVESVCSVPLNCAIVCHLWRTLEEALPTTMTELYTKIILNVILRNVSKLDLYKEVSILTDFNSLPKGLQQSWKRLCEFAFENLVKNQIVFSQQELTEFFSRDSCNIDKEILCFGLMQPAELILATGSGVSYHFLHLTFQEYLAALHMVQQPSSLALQFFDSDVDSVAIFYAISGNFTTVWKFYFGIYFQEFTMGGKRPDMKLISQHMLGIKEYIDDSILFWHCVFEAKNEIMIDEAISLTMTSDSTSEMATLANGINFGRPSTAHDCVAILYVIANIQECNKMEINFGNCGIRENQITVLTDTLAIKHGKKKVKELSLSGSKLNERSVCDLFQRASSAFQSLKRLDLENNRTGADGIKSIANALAESPSSKLKYLNLSHNPLGVPGLQALEKAICDNLLRNLEWLCLRGSLTSDADINGAILTTLIEALKAHSPKLYKLDLSQNNLSVPGASAVANIISCHGIKDLGKDNMLQSVAVNFMEQKFSVIRLNEIKLGDVGLCALVENLEMCHVKEIELRGNGIHGTCSGISRLLESLLSERHTIYLSDNPLGLEGVLAISKAIGKSCCHILELSNCQLTLSECDHHTSGNTGLFRDVGQELCQMPQNYTIKFLSLQNNNFNGERLHILSSLMLLCINLEYLKTSHCQINSEDIKKLLNQLSGHKASFPSLCSHLDHWNLNNNQLDDSGVSALLDHLPALFPKVGVKPVFHGITIKNNLISNKIATRMEEEMLKRREGANKWETNSYLCLGEQVEKTNENQWQEDTEDVEDLQIQWEFVVSLLYETIIRHVLPNCSSIHLMVVGQEKDKESLDDNNHSLGKDTIHIQELPDPVHSKDYEEAPILCNAQTMVESIAEDNHDGPIPTLLMSSTHSIHLTADDSETIVESQRIHQFVTSQSDKTSTSHYNDYDEKADANQRLIVADNHESSNVITVGLFLTMDDLASVQRTVWEGRAKWYNIGLELGLTAGMLDAIQQTNHDHTDHCFRATLKEWLSRADLQPSWSSLAAALRAPPVGLGNMAEQLLANINANKQ